MKKNYFPPYLETIRFRLTDDILGRSTENDIPVIVETVPDEPPSELPDDFWDD